MFSLNLKSDLRIGTGAVCSARRKSFRISHVVSKKQLVIHSKTCYESQVAFSGLTFRTANVQISHYLYPAGGKFKAAHLSGWMPQCNMTVMAVVIFHTSDGSINASLLTVLQVETLFL